VGDVRADLRAAEDEFTRASHLLSVVSEFAAAREHAKPGDVAAVERAATRYFSPGPGPNQSDATRRADVAFLDDALLDSNGTTRDFFAAARAYESNASRTGSGDGSVSAFVNAMESFVQGSAPHEAPRNAFVALAAAEDRMLAGHLQSTTALLVEAARENRDAAEDRLNTQYVESESDDDAHTVASTGVVQSFLDANEDPVATLSDEPIALLPVRLETRFVGDDLLVRMYPDRIHEDSHEPQLTDAERRWGENFWAYAWFATVENATAAATSFDANRSRERTRELVAMLTDLADDGYPADPAERKAAIRTRAWGQLVERFGRERAAYVVHALRPGVDAGAATQEPGVLDHETAGNDAAENNGSGGVNRATQNEGDDAVDWTTLLDPDATVASLGALTFPEPDGRPGSWTRAPVARLLPDEWLVYGAWNPGDGGDRETFLVRSGAIREPLRVGPDPDALSVATQQVADAPDASRGAEGVDWLVDFTAAERAGMALTITPSDVHDTGETPLDDGHFESLVVTGVKATMDADETAERLRDLLDAQHYTNGLSLVPQGTPTNNADEPSGYHSNADPEDTVDVDAGSPLVEHGDVSDGDVLARALAVDPSSLGDGPDGTGRGAGDHVFAHVPNADGTDQLDAWHANAALWSGTLGYYLQSMLFPNEYDAEDETPPLFDRPEDAETPDFADWLDAEDPAGLYEAYRRHFIEHVRAQGPLPTFRAGRQPYGVLPATVTDPESADRLWADQTPAGIFDRTESETVASGSGVFSAGGTGDRDWTIDGLGDDTNDSNDSADGDTSDGTDDTASADAGEDSDDEPEPVNVAEAARARDTVDDAVLAGDDPAGDFQVASPDAFRETYEPEDAAGNVPTAEIARTYEPEDAARVLSTDELNQHYDRSTLQASALDTDAKGRVRPGVGADADQEEDERPPDDDESSGGWFR
jgi:hypothetical protein